LKKWYNRIIMATKFNNKYIVKLACSTQAFSNCPQVGAVVLSESKALMNQLLSTTKKIGAPAFFGDTDSIHMRLADLPRVEEEWTRQGRKPLVGTSLGQLHDDIDCPKISGPVHKVFQSVSGLCVYVGKKAYYDEVFTKIQREKDGPFTWIRSTHCRMKGVTGPALEDAAARDFNGSLRDMYLHLYDSKPVSFNLCCTGPRVQRSTKTLSYQNIKEFLRSVRFPTPNEAFTCAELSYRVRPPLEIEDSMELDQPKQKQKDDGTSETLVDSYNEFREHSKAKRAQTRVSV